MPDSRFQNLTKQLARIKKQTSTNKIPEGEVYDLLKTMVEMRGETFNISDYGFYPHKRMINKLFALMREECQCSS